MAVGLSLLQLSSNHTAADPTASAMEAMTSTITHHAGHQDGGGGTGHAHVSATSTNTDSAPADGACPSCAEHSIMALTCDTASMPAYPN